MSWLEKIVENKGKLITGAAIAAVAVAIGILYQNYNQGESDQSNHQKMQQKIQDFKKSLSGMPMNLQNLKAVLSFSLECAKDSVTDYSKTFKQKRRQFNAISRKDNFGGYLKVILQGMKEIQQIGIVTQQKILEKLGISERQFMRHQNQLGVFLREHAMTIMQPKASEKPQLTLQQVKKAIKSQIQYLQKNGDQLSQNIIIATQNWEPHQKGMVPSLMSVIIADQVFGNEPNFDEDSLQQAQMKYNNKLAYEFGQLQNVLAPLLMKLNAAMGNNYGMGGMDMGGMEMGGMGGMDMGAMGPTLEQLQQLQMEDPQAFEQLMQMMHQQ